MKLPKVKFKLANTNFETYMLYCFCFLSKDKGKFIFMKHPKLKNLLKSAKNKKERIRIIRNYVKNVWKENIEELSKRKKIFQKEWNKINDKYMIILSDVLETKWPTSRKNIIALVSINPICPRILKTWTFSVFGLKKDIKEIYETVAHETLHFLYFSKWKDIFPKSKKRTFDIPYLEWRLSEILAPVILNNPRIQKIIKQKPREYPEHKKTKIGKNSITEHFALIYRKSLKDREHFSEFLKRSYKEIKKYKKLIK